MAVLITGDTFCCFGTWDVQMGDAVVDKELVTNKRMEKRKKNIHYLRELRT